MVRMSKLGSWGGMLVTVVSLGLAAAATRAADSPPDRQAAAARYAEILKDVATFKAKTPGDLADASRDRLKTFRADLTQVDNMFRQAAREASEASLDAPKDDSLIRLGEGRWLPRNRVSDLQSQLKDLVKRVDEAIDKLKADSAKANSKFAADDRTNSQTATSATNRMNSYANGRPAQAWTKSQTRSIAGEATKVQTALGKRDQDRATYRDQSSQLHDQITRLSEFRVFMMRTVVGPVSAAPLHN